MPEKWQMIIDAHGDYFDESFILCDRNRKFGNNFFYTATNLVANLIETATADFIHSYNHFIGPTGLLMTCALIGAMKKL